MKEKKKRGSNGYNIESASSRSEKERKGREDCTVLWIVCKRESYSIRKREEEKEAS